AARRKRRRPGTQCPMRAPGRGPVRVTRSRMIGLPTEDTAMANAQLTEELFSQLQGAPLQQISQRLGVAPERANEAVAAALPLFLGALGRNASQPQGAQALYGALGR